MAKKSTTTLEFKGLFDVSDIISKVKALRSTLTQTEANKQDILGIDQSIKRMETLQSKIKTLQKSGYSSNADIDKMAGTYKEIYELARQINAVTESMRFGNVNAELDAARKKFTSINDEVKQLTSLIAKDITQALNKIESKKEISQMFINGVKSGRAYEDVVKDINKELDRQISLQKDNIKVIQDAIAATEKERDAHAAEQLSKAGLNYVNVNRNSFNYKGTKNKVTAEDFAEVRNAYIDAIAGNKTKKDATAAFKKMLDEMGIKAVNNDTISKAITKSFNIKNSGFSSYNAQIKKLTTQLDGAKAALKTLESQEQSFRNNLGKGGNAEQSYSNLAAKIRAAEEAQSHLNEVIQKMNNGSATYQDIEKAVKQYEQATREAIKTQKDSLKTHETVESAFGKLTNAFERYFSATYIIRNVARVIRETFNDIEKLDKAFASIAMVTDKTVADLWNSYGKYQDIANRLGQSTESAIKASALYYQQGLNTAEALKLTEDTMKLATLAGADFETATRQMTAAIRGFHMEMDQGAHITDVYSELAANAAADVNGIAYAMSKAASIADSAGMSFETTAAFITNMINAAIMPQRSLITVMLY